jgi:hypothetical protein
MFALISTEDLEKDGHILVKQLKNRYNDPTFNKRFLIGVDRAKMKLYNVEIPDSSNIMIAEEEYEYEDTKPQTKFSKFTEFIV